MQRAPKQEPRALLHAFGDRRVRVYAAVDVVERRALVDEKRDALDAARRLGPHHAQEYLAACKGWPRGEVTAAFREPIRSAAPTLLLSGELDPVTPPSWAEEAQKTLPNSVHVVAPGVGHGVTSIGCFPEVVQKFIEAGSANAVDASCAKGLKRPPFFLSFAGPQP